MYHSFLIEIQRKVVVLGLIAQQRIMFNKTKKMYVNKIIVKHKVIAYVHASKQTFKIRTLYILSIESL